MIKTYKNGIDFFFSIKMSSLSTASYHSEEEEGISFDDTASEEILQWRRCRFVIRKRKMVHINKLWKFKQQVSGSDHLGLFIQHLPVEIRLIILQYVASMVSEEKLDRILYSLSFDDKILYEDHFFEHSAYHITFSDGMKKLLVIIPHNIGFPRFFCYFGQTCHEALYHTKTFFISRMIARSQHEILFDDCNAMYLERMHSVKRVRGSIHRVTFYMIWTDDAKMTRWIWNLVDYHQVHCENKLREHIMFLLEE